MNIYVNGLFFSADEQQILFVRKTHPDWQRGKLNGVGGHVEPGERPIQAMCREFEEETGYAQYAWTPFAVVKGTDWLCTFFRASHGTSLLSINFRDDLEEKCEIKHIKHLPVAEMIPNLNWLIPMAHPRSQHDWPYHIEENGPTEKF